MKIKTLSLIAAVFAVSLTATPFVANAQDAPPSPQPGKEFRRKGPWKKLGLTEEQKTKMMEIRRDTGAEVKNVLTTEQKEKLRTMMQQRRNEFAQGKPRGRGWMKNAFQQLNLTQEQKTRLREIRNSTKQKMEAVLTPAQKEQLQEMKRNRREMRRQQLNNSGTMR